MLRTFKLITNVSGLTYWSYVGNLHNTSGNHLHMVEKYGEIYINDKGGWFPKDCIRTIHKTVIQATFPQS